MNQYIAELGDEVKNEEVKKVTEQSQEDIDDENVF